MNQEKNCQHNKLQKLYEAKLAQIERRGSKGSTLRELVLMAEADAISQVMSGGTPNASDL
ncbi:hypothetical protein [Allohahella sp. A8]|uniref:hypothetical protein n=1 Tax=Allohahella sp. A8 TaxID=3141461 RepID=UPI0026BCE37F|tara:strand:- start:32703 stop:32882 length:180 start_codon:yes stop_codon:yes gene_type:complete